MELSDLVRASPGQKTGYAPSRVRKMIEATLRTLASQPDFTLSLQRSFTTRDDLAAVLQTGLDRYLKRDALLAKAKIIDQEILRIAPQLIELIHHIKANLRARNPRPRRRLDAREQLLANARRALSRKRLGVLGKHQKKRKLTGFQK